MGQRIVYQVINLKREEMFFGTTDIHLEKEMERIAKDPRGPASGWKEKDTVIWRPLTELLDERQARALHRDLERKKPPKYKVIPTWTESDAA